MVAGPDIHDVSALRRRIGRGKPISFLVGAPFSWDNGKGVPPVEGFIDIVRERVALEGDSYVRSLEETLQGISPSERYQAAMGYVYRELDADAAAEIVCNAVMKARKSAAPDLDLSSDVVELKPEHWDLTRAQRGIARLMRLKPDHFRGPIFTTNFDPLLGLALLERQIHPSVNVLPLDGSIRAPIKITQSEVNVFHLHGYWINSSTLHSPAQLLSERPQLQNSLEEHLNQTNLVVMAYGGWDDIFTTAIANVLNSGSFKGVITWCFYEQIPAVIRETNAALFDKFGAGIQQGRIQFFCGVDCHDFFDDFIEEMGISPVVLKAKESSPLAGWDIISNEYLDSLSPLDDADAVRFFDGSLPTLRHALSPLIPRLSQAELLRERIEEGSSGRHACLMQLVRAAGGEGKSTALLQATVDAVKAHNSIVVYRTSSDARLNPDIISSLSPEKQWLLITDDADDIVDDLWQCAVRLHELGRGNVFFLIGARDSDWNAAGGDQQNWNLCISRLEDVVLGGINSKDAGLVIDAWAHQGDEGLRSLKHEASRDDRIEKLMTSVRSQDLRRGEGSFFGGLLDTRFSPGALLEHVAILMKKLQQQEVDGGDGSLYDALLYIANCHAIGMAGLDKRVLASLCDLSVDKVFQAIIAKLGRELGAAESRGHVLARHRRVAEAVTTAAALHFHSDLQHIWGRLVTETINLSRRERVGDSFGPMVHSGVKLKRFLPSTLPDDLRGEIGIAAAEAAMTGKPEWSSTIIDFARALRFAGYFSEACEAMRERIPLLDKAIDRNKNIRGYFYEWSTCAGKLETRQGSIVGAWLAAYSLSDCLKVDLTLDQVNRSCAGLGVAFGRLHANKSHSVFAKGRRAVTELGRKVVLSERAARYFDKYERELDELGTPMPEDNGEALAWLGAAAQAAHGELEDEMLRDLQKDGKLSFSYLRNVVKNK